MESNIDFKKDIDESKQGENTMLESTEKNSKKLYLESYGCQMNFADSEIVASIMNKNGYNTTDDIEEADLILLNTCSIRDNAEQRIRKRLTEFRKKKESKSMLMLQKLNIVFVDDRLILN